MDFDLRNKRRAMTPNVITAFGLCCGLFIIFKSVLNTSSSTELFHRLQGLSLLLISAIIADFSDGTLARIMKVESAFGAQFDSLSDAITFGIAPPLIAIKSLHGATLSSFFSSLLLVTTILYSLCGVLRLVRYNLFSSATDNAPKVSYFIGLPIPSGAACIVSLSLFLTSADIVAVIPDHLRAGLLSVGLLFIGGLMISPWKFPSLKNLRFKVSSFLIVTATCCSACLFLLGVVDHFPEVFFLASWSYVLIVFPIFSSIHKRKAH